MLSKAIIFRALRSREYLYTRLVEQWVYLQNYNWMMHFYMANDKKNDKKNDKNKLREKLEKEGRMWIAY